MKLDAVDMLNCLVSEIELQERMKVNQEITYRENKKKLKEEIANLRKENNQLSARLRAAGKHLDATANFIDHSKSDIADYNKVIQHMIAGGCPCEWCEDLDECQLEAKGETGCSEWLLRFQEEEDTECEN